MDSEIAMKETLRLKVGSTLSAGLEAGRYLLSHAVKDSTKQQYDRVYGIWRDFCKENELPEFGCNHEHLSACLSLVMTQYGSYSMVVMLSAAIANEHRIRMLPSHTKHETISALFRGMKNVYPQDRSAKQPITVEILDKMYQQLYKPEHGRDGKRVSVVLWRTVWRISLEYCDRKGGKNDQYFEGEERVVASNPNEKRYPVRLTLHYFQFLGIGYSGYLVPSCNPKNTPNPEKSVPYSGALADMKKLIDLIGYDPKLYGEHCGKRGAAPAATARGATAKQLKRLGGWRSDSMPANYVDLSIPSRITLSEVLQK